MFTYFVIVTTKVNLHDISPTLNNIHAFKIYGTENAKRFVQEFFL